MLAIEWYIPDASLMEHVEYATRFRVQYFILHIRKYHLLLALLLSLLPSLLIVIS